MAVTDNSAQLPAPAGISPAVAPETAEMAPTKYTEAALERHKREGLELAVRARWITMGLVAIFLVFLNPNWEVLYYHFILALLCLNGWLIRRVGRVGQSRVEIALIFADLVIMTFGIVVPNPLAADAMPHAMQYRFDNFQYFFLILAAGTLAYSWRTVMAIGAWTACIWTLGWVADMWLSTPVPGLTEHAQQAFAGYPRLTSLLDPNNFLIRLRLQEVVVFGLVAVTLAVTVRRFNALLTNNASLERERANLSRYFSPNVVDQLSQNDEPLKQVRSEDIAILFVDIVGFTRFAASRDAYEVVDMLRAFHARMETEVFRHHGTLDKYLGDGLMATFGTPVAGDRDATNAYGCALSMLQEIDRWNVQRRRGGLPVIEVGIGLHYGPVVLGDIGANRLEYAVIGTAVNVASRLEALTRQLPAPFAVSTEARDQIMAENGGATSVVEGLVEYPDQAIRGIDGPVTVWAR
ncbi:adenylate/guanylate cyclase domain-containing protein [Ruegeria sp. 2012CJ41-6]|uniref:Adenylate/guanylate cyclase domain-containing protein n=1 Tax=Ruegeria spongiae TaxID=2942209 RepID=A0ABT0Q477_9RHOB|nr:adenylate/guanylate cyclase domain-containing protein [Ruegeria spongiae]MCL6284663.1 adenylate/guanylate cyclase domain-containing protein [Ruegeria spongiae]